MLMNRLHQARQQAEDALAQHIRQHGMDQSDEYRALVARVQRYR